MTEKQNPNLALTAVTPAPTEKSAATNEPSFRQRLSSPSKGNRRPPFVDSTLPDHNNWNPSSGRTGRNKLRRPSAPLYHTPLDFLVAEATRYVRKNLPEVEDSTVNKLAEFLRNQPNSIIPEDNDSHCRPFRPLPAESEAATLIATKRVAASEVAEELATVAQTMLKSNRSGKRPADSSVNSPSEAVQRNTLKNIFTNALVSIANIPTKERSVITLKLGIIVHNLESDLNRQGLNLNPSAYLDL
ncbi:MAG: hypothetical protein SFW64_04070 [Alphaproteobacteria bacterium]|nr:hypothetical protein [Alphaproteobacteria bacterium]